MITPTYVHILALQAAEGRPATVDAPQADVPVVTKHSDVFPKTVDEAHAMGFELRLVKEDA